MMRNNEFVDTPIHFYLITNDAKNIMAPTSSPYFGLENILAATPNMIVWQVGYTNTAFQRRQTVDENSLIIDTVI